MTKEEWVTGKVALMVKGVPLEFEVTVPATPVKPRRLLPIFQNMASSLADQAETAVVAQGKKISCKAHCGACCRQPVPISEMEVYHIADLVAAMPEPKRTEIRQRFANAVEHFTKIGWFARAEEARRTAREKGPEIAEREWTDIVIEYFYEGVPCPFLEDESCSIHKDRPVICREHLVTTPSEECARPSPPFVRGVELMLEPSTVLDEISGTAGFKGQGVPVLIRALEMAEAYPEAGEERTGPEWMKRFLGELSGKHVPDDVNTVAR